MTQPTSRPDPRKAIFDAVRAAAPAGLFNDPGNILALNNLLDAFGVAHEGAGRAVSDKGNALIKRFEGCERKLPDGRLTAYPDPATGGAPWTIGWGATRMDGRAVRNGDLITQEKADALLAHDIARHAAEVEQLIGNAPTTQSHFDALVSFHFNTGKLGKSTLLQKHLVSDRAGAGNEFAKWIYADGKILDGLINRRKAEAALYRGEAV